MTRWSPQEDATLSDLCGDIPWHLVPERYNSWAAAHEFPHRSAASLSSRQQALGLERQPIGEWVTTGLVCRILDISPNRIRAWLQSFPSILRPARPGRCPRSRIYIRRDRLRSLARLHPEQFAGCRADDLFMLLEDRDLADEIAADHPNPPAGLAGYRRPSRPVRCLDTNEIFPSAVAAAAAVGRSHGYLCQAIRSGWRCAGRQFAYAGQQEVMA